MTGDSEPRDANGRNESGSPGKAASVLNCQAIPPATEQTFGCVMWETGQLRFEYGCVCPTGVTC